MTEEADHRAAALTELTADVVAAYVSNNPVPVGELPSLIASLHASLSGLSKTAAPAVEMQVPAVNPKKSVTPDFIICLDDGKKFKSLKRHLRNLGLTPDEYRAKWKLPDDYPMVARNYAEQRSALAKSFGLGRKPVPQKKAPAKRTAKVA
ncbi:transcriptional regulator [Mesorhizobium sp. B2-4-9]|nr:MucR family transcriptional regulator [Mesorhizobium sp. B2-4-9]TPL21103.1 transcriptional regulator [Mesorhizobium sp. B2-4-9]